MVAPPAGLVSGSLSEVLDTWLGLTGACQASPSYTGKICTSTGNLRIKCCVTLAVHPMTRRRCCRVIVNTVIEESIKRALSDRPFFPERKNQATSTMGDCHWNHYSESIFSIEIKIVMSWKFDINEFLKRRCQKRRSWQKYNYGSPSFVSL